ncbi:MAG TPA: DUF2809 domain-containing protein, partial [Spirochaetota bacterium]|nr:DUF2809 domain-containing protein [Spirochaetota bacterium]
RMVYAALSLLLFTAGVLLVRYGRHFPHLRGWFGDYMITIFLFFSFKVIFPLANGVRLAAGVFVFSTVVEFIQLSGIARRFDLTSAFWQLTIGSRFDTHDIAMYAAGCVTAAVADIFIFSFLYRHNRVI